MCGVVYVGMWIVLGYVLFKGSIRCRLGSGGRVCMLEFDWVACKI